VIFFRSPSDTKSVDVSTILAHIKTDINNNQKDTLNVSSNTITLTRGATQDAAKESATINDTFDTTKVLKDNGIDYANSRLLTLQYEPPSALGTWINLLVSFIPFILIGGLLIFMMRQAQGSNNRLSLLARAGRVCLWGINRRSLLPTLPVLKRQSKNCRRL
jgi:cell division protease FtsH